jgi:hypothetical protein
LNGKTAIAKTMVHGQIIGSSVHSGVHLLQTHHAALTTSWEVKQTNSSSSIEGYQP